MTSNRSKFIQEPKNETTCNRCDALGHWEDECPQKKKDTAGVHHQVMDPAEGSENNRARERGHRKARAKAQVAVVKFEEAFPIQEVYRGDLEQKGK